MAITNQLNLIIEQARAFLTDADEFYPFGTIVNADGTLSPIGVQIDNDHPESLKVLQILQESIIEWLKSKRAVAGAICLDVLYTAKGSSVKLDALKVMMLTSEGHSRDYIVPYRKEGETYFFDKIIFEAGTLKLN